MRKATRRPLARATCALTSSWGDGDYVSSLSRATTYWPISCPSTSRSSPGCEGLVARGHDSSLFFPPTPNTCV